MTTHEDPDVDVVVWTIVLSLDVNRNDNEDGEEFVHPTVDALKVPIEDVGIFAMVPMYYCSIAIAWLGVNCLTLLTKK